MKAGEISVKNQSILWRRLDQPGHEAAQLSFQESSWRLIGTAVFVYNRQPCRLSYRVVCDAQWRSVSGGVAGWLGDQTVDTKITIDAARRWWVNGTEYPQVAGCLDLDLNFSPSTNLLPIRRLDLAVGQEANVTAAWLHFPNFTLEPLSQVYRRIDLATYHYESAGGAFVAELAVNAAGFVTDYPNLWTLEAGA